MRDHQSGTRNLVMLVFLFIFPIAVNAHWDASISYERQHNSNPFRSVETTPTWIDVYNFSLSKTFTHSSFGYFGNYGEFGQQTSRNFYWHELAWWGSSGGTSYGINAEQRLNSSDYSLYNYNTATAYLLHRIYTDTGLWQFEGTGQAVFYPELKHFNYTKFNAGALVNRAFPTRTTLIVNGRFYYKQYLAESISGISQFYGRFRVAQSVTATTGLALQYSQRIILGHAAKTINEIPYTTYQESEIFDDPMSYNGQTAGAELTQLLPFQIILKGAYYSNWRQYIGQPAYVEPDIYDTEIQRNDESKTAWIYLEKTFDFKLISQNSVTLTLTYQWKKNQSNSYWYKYTTKYGSLGIQYNF